jgi:hypothetical protein
MSAYDLTAATASFLRSEWMVAASETIAHRQRNRG